MNDDKEISILPWRELAESRFKTIGTLKSTIRQQKEAIRELVEALDKHQKSYLEIDFSKGVKSYREAFDFADKVLEQHKNLLEEK